MTMKLNKIHHVAVICSDYKKSKHFYTDVLGMNPPARPSYPEAAGLRHLAFEVDDLSVVIDELDNKDITHDSIRTDEYTGKRFVFFSDPDGLPIELYEK